MAKEMVTIMAKRTPEYEVERMRNALGKNGFYYNGASWVLSESFTDRRTLDAAVEEGRQAGRIEAASEAIRAFGLADRYPDVSEEKTSTRSKYYGSGIYFPEEFTYTVTTPGAIAFLEDMATVATSRDVAEASKRLGLR